MKRLLALALLPAMVAPGPALAVPKPIESWGREGVDFETYRKDSVECARLAYYADISETDHAKAFVAATRKLQTSDDSSMAPPNATNDNVMSAMVDNAARSESIRRSIQPEKRMHELHLALVGIVEQCLTERGYSKFRLTEDQASSLKRLKKGSSERHQFLFALSTNPVILETQAVRVDKTVS